MPSALEALVKAIRQEQQQGYQNTAVSGGMASFAQTWQRQARNNARRAQHHILIDEIMDVLGQYDATADSDERAAKLEYLLLRITNRAKPPENYLQRLPEWEAKMQGSPPNPPRDSQEKRKTRRRSRQQGNRTKQGKQQPYFKTYDGDGLDIDYSKAPRHSKLDIAQPARLQRPPRQPRPRRSHDEQYAALQALDEPTESLKGIGKKFAELLQELDLHTVGDLLFHLPRNYIDYTELSLIADLTADESHTVIATVQSVKLVSGRNGRQDLLVRVHDETAGMTIRFFSQPFLRTKLRRGLQLVLHGRVRYFRDSLQMSNPEWEELDLQSLHQAGIVPVYRMTKGLRPRLFRRTMKALVDEIHGQLVDPLPLSVLERVELADLGWAIQQVHLPAGRDHIDHAKRRLAFDQHLLLQLALLGKRRSWQSSPCAPMEVKDSFLDSFVAAVFPYTLTAGQQEAVADIREDFGRALPMNRLLQGDVGSGKTAVCLAALAIVHANGKQSVLMVPTSILAEQHYRVISAALEKLPDEERPTVALLTGALGKRARAEISEQLASGAIDVLIGTHAVIQPGLEFQDLAFAIVDEQHRFGVEQRAALRGKGGNPHLLVLSATPFPRSLALTLYADLDHSIIREKPAERREVETKIIERAARERMNGFVINQLEQGRQAFFVQPLVEKSETIASASAIEAYEELRHVFFRFRVCLLHGRMSAAEKDEVMAAFAAGEHDVMVTTSVAEVGVDVPNATVMVIDGANRFGLAQLHQFRGRVGRGAHESYCFLLPDALPEISLSRIQAVQAGEANEDSLSIAERRLLAMEESSDGFALAERDWQMRGAGELLGKLQSGRNPLHSLDGHSDELLADAQAEAQTLFAEDPSLEMPEHRLLADYVHRRYPDVAEIS